MENAGRERLVIGSAVCREDVLDPALVVEAVLAARVTLVAVLAVRWGPATIADACRE